MRRGARLAVPWGLATLLVVGVVGAALPAAAVPTCGGMEITLPVGTTEGTNSSDVMMGTPGDDTISGGLGRDVICGGGGNDRLLGGPGNDTLNGGDGDDRLFGQQGCETLNGGSGNDLLYPGAGKPWCAGTLDGQGGRDRMIIDAYGRNDIFGGLGRDTLDFRKSPVGMLVHLDEAPPTYDFIDVLTTNSVIYDVEVVFGSQVDDLLYGGDGNDILHGFGGDDYLYGGNGDDTLIGGEGIDDVDGFNGHDICEGETLQLCND
jgi:Ca2+-binding RTX toxin-like protein